MTQAQASLTQEIKAHLRKKVSTMTLARFKIWVTELEWYYKRLDYAERTAT